MIRIKEFLIIILVIIIIIFGVFYIRRLNELEEESDELQQEVLLYFSSSDAMYLETEKRTVEENNLYMNTLRELIAGPESSSLEETIPEEVEVINFSLDGSLAEVDFNRKLVEEHWGGSTGERITVYSIVNTLAQFPEIEKVQILVNGKELETLAGHMDISGPLEPSKDIVSGEGEEE
ncbi:MAG: GerMN domain-containing protein [Halanaerobiaceae bacterium]